MKSCPHCGRDLQARGGPSGTEQHVREIMEQALAVPLQPDAYILQDALRLIANEDATPDDIYESLAAWNAGKKPEGVKRLKMFQAKNWPRVRKACLGEAAPEDISAIDRILSGKH